MQGGGAVEADLSTECTQAEKGARVSQADVEQERTESVSGPSS